MVKMCTTESQAIAEQAEWLITALGKSMPNQFGNQCTAAMQWYSVAIFGRPWIETLRMGNAIDHMDNANPVYFEKIWNNPKDANQLPRAGDIAVYRGAAPLWDGRFYGHTGAVTSFTAAKQVLVQQDGAAPPTRVFPDGYSYSVKPAHKGTFFYIGDPSVGDIRGWLRPRWQKVAYSGADKRGYGAVSTAPKRPSGPVQAPVTGRDGIDVSNWQRGIDLARIRADFVGVLATDGASFVSPTLGAQLGQAQKLGRSTLVYHYARVGESDSSTQAKWFLRAAADWIRKGAVPVLDWEEDAWNHRADWARDWIREVEAATGKQVVVYQRIPAAKHASWGSFRRPMWLSWYGSSSRRSGYATDFSARPAVPGWDVALWQYSDNTVLPGYGGPLDVNRYFGGISQWDRSLGSTAGGSAAQSIDGGVGKELEEIMGWYKGGRKDFEGWIARKCRDAINELMPKIVQNVWAYKNKRVNGDRDAYEILTEMSRRVEALEKKAGK